MFSDELVGLATRLLAAARAKGAMIATAESCTGGLIAGLLTEIPGSSDVVDRGFVTYSNDAKEEMLDVPHDLLAAHGAVSEPVVAAMAEGALAHSRAQLSVAVTGIAGPGGGSAQKPVGLVYIAAMRAGNAPVVRQHLFGDIGREQVRLATVEAALRLVQTLLG
ncbi:MAG: damage-inducible protein CinA [Alphaproteobacteria bacterium 64-11]|nr:CinA family protein [Alphaproteobacteria bacterium]OJU11234.1 MAG: damage-inducible protein CinA [Alphaproteobacteria bacterium 64-11]